MKEQPAASDDLSSLRRQARLNELRLQIAQQNEALAALRRAGCRDSLEGSYDDPSNWFDPRDYLIDVPRGLGGAIPSTRNDRDQGRDFPIFRTEQELAVIRGAARLLTSTSPIAAGILTTLTNYVIGPGFHYAVAPRAAMSLVGAGELAAIASRAIDEFLDENDWLGDLDRELFQRSRVDGEYFLGLWHVGNGHVQARAVEPDQVTEPSNKLGLDEWLGCAASAACAASPSGGWTFGVHTEDVDAQAVHGYYVQWTNRDTEWDYFPGGNEPILSPDGAGLWMEHAKLNVVRSVKRGLSDFYSIQGNLDLARRVLRNMGEGAAVQAAIAWIQETAPGTTQAQASSATLARADARYTTQTSQGSRQHTAQHYDPATILKVPSGQKYLPGPLGAQNASSFITAAEALLRTVAVRWSLPENLVTGTAENNNFASSLVAESPFVKFAESQQRFYARRDRRTLKRVLWFAWSAGRFGDVPWTLVDRALEISVTPPQVEVRDPEKETQVRAALHAAGILSKKTWSAQEGLDFDAEQKNLAAEARAEAQSSLNNGAASDDSSHAQADRSSAESLEADWDPAKHPRGGNPENRGEFSKVAGSTGAQRAAATDPAGPTNRAAEIVHYAAAKQAQAPAAAAPAPDENRVDAAKAKILPPPLVPRPAVPPVKPSASPAPTPRTAAAGAVAYGGLMATIDYRGRADKALAAQIDKDLTKAVNAGDITRDQALKLFGKIMGNNIGSFHMNPKLRAEKVARETKNAIDETARTNNMPIEKPQAGPIPYMPAAAGGGKGGTGTPPTTGEQDDRRPRRYRGGRHRDTSKPSGDGLESHHIPPDSVNGLPKNDGPAIQMEPLDHINTSSHGSKGEAGRAFRAKQKSLIDKGQFGAAIQMEIDDIRARYGRKYDQAIREMIDSLDPWMRRGLKG